MAPSPITRAYYPTPEGQVHYRFIPATVKDASKAPVVLLHMSACSGLYYEALILLLANSGYDCYAPDIPGFGQSYHPEGMTPNIRYYVDVFMLGVKHWELPKFHILGHHTGASIATELAAVYGEQVLTLTVIGAALLNREEQQAYLAAEVHPYNKPVMDGSHWKKVWDQLLTNGEWSVKDLHEQTLDAVAAWEGRMQAYTCVFNQPAMEVLGQVKVPVLAMCAPGDSLYPKFYRVKEILPNATCVDVEGVDFEPMRDPQGIHKAFVEFHSKL